MRPHRLLLKRCACGRGGGRSDEVQQLHLHASPPCNYFSPLANCHPEGLEDKRFDSKQLVEWVLRLVLSELPERVPGAEEKVTFSFGTILGLLNPRE